MTIGTKIDKTIDYLICNIFPFVIIILGTYVGYLFGNFFVIMSLKNIVYPKFIGGFIGFIIFGIIARFSWNDSRNAEFPKEECK